MLATKRGKTKAGAKELSPLLIFEVGPYQIPVFLKELEGAHGYFEFVDEGPRIFVGDHTLGTPAFTATVCHELAHAWDEIHGLGLKHRQVRALGNAMAQSFGTEFLV